MIKRETKTPIQKERKEGEITDSSKVSVNRHFPATKNELRGNPVHYEALMHAVKNTLPSSAGIFVKVDSLYKKIMPEDIYLVEALSDYVHIHTKKKRYTIYSTMISVEEKLSKTDFVRAHRSYIVRINSISSFEGSLLSVEDRLIPMGNKYKREVLSRLKFL